MFSAVCPLSLVVSSFCECRPLVSGLVGFALGFAVLCVGLLTLGRLGIGSGMAGPGGACTHRHISPEFEVVLIKVLALVGYFAELFRVGLLVVICAI